MRKALLALGVIVLTVTAAPAQTGWAEKMFKDGVAHDFGSVPRGAQLLHRFTITNIYAVRMEITGIHPGCGCVTAAASKRVLEPRETATIDVSMDAKRFTGAKTVLVRVTVGPEYTSSAELKVSANSRTDVVFNPGEVNFGNVVRGQKPEQAVDVEYAGTLDFKVSEVVAKDLPLDVSCSEAYRRPGQVGYKVTVKLKGEVPAGPFKEAVYLKTNDPSGPLVPLLVEATVQAAVTAAPGTLSLTNVKAGDALTRKVVLRGAKPFKVLGVDGVGDGVELAEAPGGAAAVQTVTFKCQFARPGEVKRELKIKTDLQDAPLVVTLEANVTP